METEKLVRTIQVNYDCDKCGRGNMKSTGMGSINNLYSQFYHKCDICGAEEKFNKIYPYIKYETVVSSEYDYYEQGGQD